MNQDNRNENEEDKYDSVKAIYKEFRGGPKNTLVDIARIASILSLNADNAIKIVGDHCYFIYFDGLLFEYTDLEGFERLLKYSAELDEALDKAIKSVQQKFIPQIVRETGNQATGLTTNEINVALEARLTEWELTND